MHQIYVLWKKRVEFVSQWSEWFVCGFFFTFWSLISKKNVELDFKLANYEV